MYPDLEQAGLFGAANCTQETKGNNFLVGAGERSNPELGSLSSFVIVIEQFAKAEPFSPSVDFQFWML